MEAQVLIFKTNILSVEQANAVLSVQSGIQRWNVDLEDRDKVLRIETSSGLQKQNIIDFLKPHNIYCEELE